MDDLFVNVPPDVPNLSGYESLIVDAFFARYEQGSSSVEFSRNDIRNHAKFSAKNIGDVIYSYRYRKPMPKEIANCAPPGKGWIIKGTGDAKYKFVAVKNTAFLPNPNIVPLNIPDLTPEEILNRNGPKDEQVILASIRANRLLDLFLGVRLIHLQSHHRTNVKDIGQIEIDDVYLGIDGLAKNIVVTVQAKRDRDIISPVQIAQDIAVCNEKNDGRTCRPTAVHYDSQTGVLAVMEFQQSFDDEIILVNEKHYILKKERFAF